jgi:branched-chain amino acid transport system permease protein
VNLRANPILARLAPYVPLLALLVPLLLLAVIAGLWGNVLFVRVVIIFFINLIMVVALQTYMGNSGVASFGHVGFMLMGAYGSILFTMTPQQKSVTLPDMPHEWWIYSLHMPLLPALLITALIVVAIGGLVGLVLLRIGATAAGFTSFALLIVIRIVALSSDPLTRGTRTVVGISDLTTLPNTAAWALLFVSVAYLFKESALGLKLRATREDERAAENFGISPLRVRWVSWVLSIAMTAVAGGLWAHFVTVFSPHSFWIPVTFMILSMLVIGGQGSVAGAVVGAASVTLVSEGLLALEYSINIGRQSVPWLAAVFPNQVVGLTEFFLAIVLLLILTLRPSGIMKGREFKWLVPEPIRPEPAARRANTAEAGGAGAHSAPEKP